MLCSAAVALVGVATNVKGSEETHEAPTPLRRLAGGGSSYSSSGGGSSSPSPKFFVYVAPTTPAACTEAINSETYLEAGNNDKETNWDDVAFGHAQYVCLEPMIRGNLQYDKAISYAWCVYPHCEEKCPGEDCPVHDTVAKCQSAVKNWLGYAERKKANANFVEAQKYYEEAIDGWKANCGALGYRAELELQKGDTASARSRLSALCTMSACSDSDAVRETATTFWKHENKGRNNLPSECDWALSVGSSMAPAHRITSVWVVALVGAMVSAMAI